VYEMECVIEDKIKKIARDGHGIVT